MMVFTQSIVSIIISVYIILYDHTDHLVCMPVRRLILWIYVLIHAYTCTQCLQLVTHYLSYTLKRIAITHM